MIEKFISIKNIGRFRNCTSLGDVALRKLSLLFAENGRGKTTLCAILRSLQSGQATFISERKTLGANDPATVQILLGGRNINFANEKWSATHPNIEIFDSVFIHDNVYAGDYVEHDHKKNLYRVIIGEQGVGFAHQIEELDAKIRDANTSIRTAKESLPRVFPNGTTIETYLEWLPVEDVETKIQQKTAEIAACQHALDKAAEIGEKGLLNKIALPAFPSDFLSVLDKQLEDITEDTENRVRQQINSHKMGRHGEAWLAQGLPFVSADKCPFCGQSINENAIIAAYRSHFNAAYNELKQEVAKLEKLIIGAIGGNAINRVQETLSSNLTLTEFWKQFCNITVVEIDFSSVRAKYAALLEVSIALAKQKEQTPTEPVIPSNDFKTAQTAIDTVKQSVTEYNAAVDKVNVIIRQQKTAAQQGNNVNDLKAELILLEAKKQRFTKEVGKACEDYKEALNKKTNLEQNKETAKQELDEYCQQILQTYEASINGYLEQFNTGFRITNSRHLYTGGTPSSHYQIVINDNAVNLGDSKTKSGTPCFKTTLSSGDRSALALAFFLASLCQDQDIANKIVVLDDPFTSQDRFRRNCTQQLICKLAATAKQVILLSHDAAFLRLVWDNHNTATAEIKVLQLSMMANSTTIAECDIEAETQSAYLKDHATLLQYSREHSDNPLGVARSIRPFIEGWLRSHFPGRFSSNEWLGNFIDKIRNAQPNDGLEHAKTDLPELEAINDYSKKYHHEQNTEAPSADELHGFVKRTLRLAGGA
ncbi:MAG: AAA family ATPase [Thermoguttaceae bacterium]